MMASKLQVVREIKGILVPLMVVTMMVALGLKALDFAPAQLGRLGASVFEPAPTLRILKFESLEEAERKLGIRILLPVYFPDYLIWPAASIYAQHEPLTVTVIFRSVDLREGLLVRQSFAKGDEPLPLLAEPSITLRRTVVQVDGRFEGILIEGKDNDGDPRNQLHWKLGDRHMSLATTYPVRELMLMAESIHYRLDAEGSFASEGDIESFQRWQ